MTRPLAVRGGAFAAAFALVVLVVFALSPPARAAGFQPFSVNVAGVKVKPKTVVFETEGPVSLYDVVVKASGLGAFDFKGVDAASVYNGTGTGTGNKRFSREQLLGSSANLPSFEFSATKTVMTLPGGKSVTYCGETSQCDFLSNPGVTVELKEDQGSVLAVILNADATTVKVGSAVGFEARVVGATRLRFSWDFGDGSRVSSGGQRESHRYRKAGSFTARVTVTDLSTGKSRIGSLRIRVRKDEPKKKPQRSNGDGDPAPAGSGGYYGGYPGGSGGLGDGGGGSGNTGGGSGGDPGLASPASPEPEDKPQQVVDDGLVPVRGELLDPSIPAQVIEPSTEEPGESAGPAAEEKRGFALSGGAKTALGIAALLGIGGLAEIGSFARFSRG